ncbi:type 1 fimbrial protein [Yersinia ruckeri]
MKLLISTILLPAIFLFSEKHALGADISLHGTLIESLPCTVKPDDQSSEVRLGAIYDKYLYQYQRTAGKVFYLHLEHCDLSLANSMTILFTGQENPKLPGLLALEKGSQASGIGIGLETVPGKKIALDKPSDPIPLIGEDNIISLRAYIAAEQNAIEQRSITPGFFSSIATFSISYN